MRKWIRRRPAIAGLMGISLLLLLGLVVGTTIYSLRLKAARNRLEQNLYASEMAVAFAAWDRGNVTLPRDLLQKQVPPHGRPNLRGFEWYYLDALCRTQELFSFPRGPEPIFGLACSPNGRLVAAGQQDGTIRLLDLVTRAEAGWLRSPGQAHATGDSGLIGAGAAYTVAFSSDGKRLVATTTSQKHELHLWNVEKQSYEGSLAGHSMELMAAAFSPDDRWIASTAGIKLYGRTNSGAGEIFIWDAHTRAKLFALEGPAANAWKPAFSPDSRLLATPHGDGTIVLWDLASRESIKIFGPHQDIVSCVCFSPDGKQLASASMDRTVRVWNLADGQQFLVGWHAAPVDCVAFSRDGRWLASSSRDATIRLWEVANLRKPPVIFRGHTGRIWSVAFTPDSQTLVSGSLDQTVRLWDISSRHNDTLLDPDSNGFGLRFSPDGRLTARSETNRVFVRNLASRTVLAELTAVDVLFSPKGDLLVGTTATNAFTIWDAQEFKPLTNVLCEARLENLRCFSPDSRLLAVCRYPNVVELRDTTGWGLRDTWKPDNAGLYQAEDSGYRGSTGGGLAFSPDGKLLALARLDSSVRIYGISSRRQVLKLETDLKWANHLAWLPHSRTLVITSGFDSMVLIWDLDGAGHEALKSEAGNVGSISVSPDGKTLAVGTQDGAIVLWNIPSRRQITTLKGHLTIVGGLAFSPDGRCLVSEGGDGVRVWRAAAAVE
jgi:WD40 repeat protein